MAAESMPLSSAAVAHPPARASAVGAWILFDWAAQPFFTLVTTFVFGPYVATRLADSAVAGQAAWGYATAAAGLVIALLSPLLGAVADAAGARKRWIFGFSILLVGGTASLWWTAPGAPHALTIALVGFAVASVGVEFATVFNNAMLPGLVRPARLGRLSGDGWAAGYVSGLVCILIAFGFLIASPESGLTLLGTPPAFGLDPAAFEGVRLTGPFTAVWYAVFVLPMFLLVPDLPARPGLLRAVRTGFADLAAAVERLPRDRRLVGFLVAHMVYTDGLAALFAFGGIYAAARFEWGATEIGLFGILIMLAGAVGTFLGGRLDDRFGSRPIILAALLALIVAGVGLLSVGPGHVLFWVTVAPPVAGDGLFGSFAEKFYLALGVAIGLGMGPLQASSRSFVAQLAPPGAVTRTFGLFALSGKVTSFLAPAAVATVTAWTSSTRLGVATILAFFIVGAVLMVLLPREAAPEGRR